jgi:hypothetical protein
MADGDGWFREVEDDRWAVDVPEADRAELASAVSRLHELLLSPATATLRVDASHGASLGASDLALVVEESGEVVGQALAAPWAGDGDLTRLAAAAANLRVIAAAVADALATGPVGGEDEAMGLAASITHLLERVLGALERSVTPTDHGTFRLRWTPGDRQLVRTLAGELQAALDGDDDALVRLFPPAYGTDEVRSREYAALARDELITSRRAALATVESAMGRDEVDADELHALMRAVNDLRLVLGTQLDVTEDDVRRRRSDDPDAPRWAAYERLTRILGQIVTALSGA